MYCSGPGALYEGILRNPQMALNMKDLYGNSGSTFKKINGLFLLSVWFSRSTAIFKSLKSDLPCDHLCSPSFSIITNELLFLLSLSEALFTLFYFY